MFNGNWAELKILTSIATTTATATNRSSIQSSSSSRGEHKITIFFQASRSATNPLCTAGRFNRQRFGSNSIDLNGLFGNSRQSDSSFPYIIGSWTWLDDLSYTLTTTNSWARNFRIDRLISRLKKLRRAS